MALYMIYLGGGFKYILMFLLGEDVQFFKWVGSTTSQRMFKAHEFQQPKRDTQ